MPNNRWDAAIKQVYPADDGTSNFAETVQAGKAFDVIASVEIGRNLMEFVDEDELWVTVSNLSRVEVLAKKNQTRPIAPASSPLTDELRVDIGPGWSADIGDVLQVVATYKARAGLHTDFDSKVSQTFVVVP